MLCLLFSVSPAHALDETFTEQLIPNEFQGGGVGQGLHCDDASTCLSPLEDWIYALPFPFKMYNLDYTEILLGSEGGIIFDTSDVYAGSDQMHNFDWLTYGAPFIAPLGHEYTTHTREGDDIYITESVDNLTKTYDHVIIRWQTATRYSWRDLDPANFELVLYRNGNVKFNYAYIEDAGAWGVNGGVGFGLGDGVGYTQSVYYGTQPIGLLNDAQTSAWGVFGPEALTAIPANRDVGVPLDQQLSLTFDKSVHQGTGTLEIRKTVDDELVESFVSASSQITGWGTDTVTITPNDAFIAGTQYYVTVTNSFAEDGSTIFFPGIDDKMRWTFLTMTDDENFSFADDLKSMHFLEVNTELDQDLFGGNVSLLTYAFWGMGETPKYDVFWNQINPGDWMTRSVIGVDSSNNPIIVFEESHYPPSPTPDSVSIGVARWNGHIWTGMDGTSKFDTLFESIPRYRAPRVILDANDYPIIFTYYSSWGSGGNAAVTRWNGSIWTQMDGVTSGYEVLSDSSGPPSYPSPSIGQTPAGDPYYVIYDPVARDMFYSQWNGSAWVYADGVTLGIENVSNTGIVGTIYLQTVRFDNSGAPYIVWSDGPAGGKDVFLARWNGSTWTQMDGVTLGSENISNSSGNAAVRDIFFNALNQPVTFYNDDTSGSAESLVTRWNGTLWTQMDGVTPGYETILGLVATNVFVDAQTGDYMATERVSTEIYASRWNGTAWTQMDRLTPGSEKVLDMSATPSYVDLITEDNNDPIYLWEEYDNGYLQYASRWNGTAWTQMDRATPGYEDYTNRTGYMYGTLAYDNDGEPIFAWGSSDGGTNSQIHVSRYAPHALSPETIMSKKVNGMIEDISTIAINATDDTPGNSTINYSVTNDGGSHWHNVTKGQVFTFPFVGNDLRWKAALHEGSVPTLHDITLNYAQQTVVPPIPPDPPTQDITPQLTKLTNIGRKNLTLKAQIQNNTYYNQELTFTVKITNKDKGKDEERSYTKTTDSEGKVSIDINGLKENTNYSFRILFSDGTYTSIYSNKEEVKTKTDITNTKQTPSDLEALADSYTSITITWKDNAEGENGYIIERRAYNETDFTPLTNLPKNSQEYTDTGLYAGSTYTYRVRAYHGNNYTGYSNEDSDQTPVYVKTEGTTTQPTTPEPIEPEPLPTEPTEEVITPEPESESETTPEPEEERPAPQQPATDPIEQESSADNDTNNTEPSVLSATYTKVKDFAQTPQAEQSIKTATIIGTIGGIILTAAATSLPLITTASATGGFSMAAFGLLGLFAKRKEEGQWGTVFETQTKRQIPGIKVLINQAQGTLTDNTNTNAHGQYGFLPQPGTYNLDIESEELVLDRVNTQDSLYGNVYNGQPFQTDPQTPVSMSIAARSNTNWSAYADKKINWHTSFFHGFLKLLLNLFFYGGFILVLVITFLNPITLNLIFFGIYTFFLILTLFKRKKRSYGIITSQETKEPIPFAIVSLYDDAHSEKRKSFAVTDALGRYFLLTDEGDYFMKVEGQARSGQRVSFQDSVRVKGNALKVDVVV